MNDRAHKIGYEEIIVGPYSDAWPKMFEEEKARILKVIPSGIVDIEHIGSTAVPGLEAKPIIDMMAGVNAIKGADAMIPVLKDLGYLYPEYYNSTLKGRHWLMRMNNEQTERTHHLHILPFLDPGWNQRLKFRNALRVNPEIAKEYAKLKKELAAQYKNDREAYGDAKKEFIENIIGENLGVN